MPDTSAKTFELSQFVPYLMARVGSLMSQSFSPRIEEAGITLQMWRVLMVLNFNGPQTLIDISRITGVKTSTLSRLIGRMIEKRLVSRRRSRQDARTVQISLRPKGEAMFARLWPEAKRLSDVVSAPFGAADLGRFKEMLREIEAILVRQVDAAHKDGTPAKSRNPDETGA